MNNEIIIFENQDVKLEVNMKDETVWLSLEQMAKLFGRNKSVISRHIKNIFKEEELENSTVANFATVQLEGTRYVNRDVEYYNLDMIISVGYRVKSKNGILFRKWASKILKEYMLNGYVINQKRLEYLEKTVKIIDIATRRDALNDEEAHDILRVIGEYSKALDLLDDYDHRSFSKQKGSNSLERIKYIDCIEIISKLKFYENSSIFALERDNGLESIISDIYQTFDGNDLYKTIEEKAANFIYMVVKNHVFIDGNKRIAATLFLYFLNFYNILYRNHKQTIDDKTLAALTILIAESNPLEKDVIIELVINFII